MSIGKQAFGQLQKVGKALMLPVSVLPVAGILLGVGAADFSWLPEIVSSIMKDAGDAVFGNMALLFAIGVALGFTKNDGVAALAATVGYFIMVNTIEAIAPGTNVGVLGGILAGSVAGWAFNRFFRIELPAYLGFFAGKRAVPIITGFGAMILGIILSVIWPPVGGAIQAFSDWAANQNPTLAFGIYGIVERALIPFGLHHIWNVPFQFEAGTCVNAAGETLHGIITCYSSADDASRAAGNGFGQLAGGFLFKMYGLPAAAIAIWHTAKPENRAKVGGIMISAALTSFLTGITEPIEFAFMFVAPVLYIIHAILAGLAFVITNAFGLVHGTTFSHGFIDFTVLFSKSQNGLLFPVFGLAYAVIYYVIFRTAIVKFKLKTPGREDEAEATSATTAKPSAGGRIGDIITAFGGAQNIATLDNCITRLRIDVKDVALVNSDALKALGATGVLMMGNGVQAIFGLEADTLRTKMADFIESNDTQPVQAAAPKEAVQKPAVQLTAAHQDLAAQLIIQLGGKANIQDVLACATSRLRLELKQKIDLDLTPLKALGVKHIMPINDTVIHLLLNEEAASTELAMKEQLI